MHILLATLLSGAMRWDIRDPARRFADRFVLGAGHTIPLVYCTLAVLNEALRIKHRETGDDRYRILDAEHRALYWEDLTGFRRLRRALGTRRDGRARASSSSSTRALRGTAAPPRPASRWPSSARAPMA